MKQKSSFLSKQVDHIWQPLAWRGGLIVALGLLLVFFPLLAAQTFILFLGALLLIESVPLFFVAIRTNLLSVFLDALIAAVTGTLILCYPTIGLQVAMIILGIRLVVGGFSNITTGLRWQTLTPTARHLIWIGMLFCMSGAYICFRPLTGTTLFVSVVGIAIGCVGVALLWLAGTIRTILVPKKAKRK